jgi:hypothetical protein
MEGSGAGTGTRTGAGTICRKISRDLNRNRVKMARFRKTAKRDRKGKLEPADAE